MKRTLLLLLLTIVFTGISIAQSRGVSGRFLDAAPLELEEIVVVRLKHRWITV